MISSFCEQKIKEIEEELDRAHRQYNDRVTTSNDIFLLQGKLEAYNEILSLAKKEEERIKEELEEKLFDLHYRFCKLEDVGGTSQEMCRVNKELIIKELFLEEEK